MGHRGHTADALAGAGEGAAGQAARLVWEALHAGGGGGGGGAAAMTLMFVEQLCEFAAEGGRVARADAVGASRRECLPIERQAAALLPWLLRCAAAEFVWVADVLESGDGGGEAEAAAARRRHGAAERAHDVLEPAALELMAARHPVVAAAAAARVRSAEIIDRLGGSHSIVIFFRHQSHNIARLAFCMDQRHSPSISAAGTADGPAGGQAMGQAGHAREAGRPKFGGDELRARWVDLLAAATAAGAAAPTPGPAACCSPACSWFRVSFRKKREKKETRKVKEVLEKM